MRSETGPPIPTSERTSSAILSESNVIKRIVVVAVLMLLAACSVDRATGGPGEAVGTARTGQKSLGGNVSPDAMSIIVERCEDHVGWFCDGDYGAGFPDDPPIFNSCTLYPETCEYRNGGGEAVANPVVAPPSVDSYDGMVSVGPNCNSPQNAHEVAWCTGVLPSQTQRSRLSAALSRMAAKGGTCAVSANIGQTLLANNQMKIASNYSFGGAAPGNQGANGWIVLNEYWANTAFDALHELIQFDSQGVSHARTLQQLLAHEIDHLRFGGAHADPDGFETANSRACSDVP